MSRTTAELMNRQMGVAMETLSGEFENWKKLKEWKRRGHIFIRQGYLAKLKALEKCPSVVVWGGGSQPRAFQQGRFIG
ncbi:hypothetical protein CDAR_320981 [Caerostris darwini]|uniref:Uncharacterized protein n=1 Tax=Caerostris darwini TaxID=1538125 RepID=A0AAV4X138_9ARAC|nr:hypothetical protein CDAR_320981 [Caerostris darwini]